MKVNRTGYTQMIQQLEKAKKTEKNSPAEKKDTIEISN